MTIFSDLNNIDAPYYLENLTLEQQVEVAIRCAMAIHDDPDFHRWGNDWISGKDRTEKSAWATWEAKVEEATLRAVRTARLAKEEAGRAKVEAGREAKVEEAGREAKVAKAAWAELEAAEATIKAVKILDKNIDLQKIIDEVTKYERIRKFNH